MNFYTEKLENAYGSGMVSYSQIARIKNLMITSEISQPEASLLKSISSGRALSVDELTCQQANQLIRMLNEQVAKKP